MDVFDKNTSIFHWTLLKGKNNSKLIKRSIIPIVPPSTQRERTSSYHWEGHNQWASHNCGHTFLPSNNPNNSDTGYSTASQNSFSTRNSLSLARSTTTRSRTTNSTTELICNHHFPQSFSKETNEEISECSRRDFVIYQSSSISFSTPIFKFEYRIHPTA